MKTYQKLKTLCSAILFLGLCSCISPKYSETAYTNAIDLKIETLDLVDKSTYSDYNENVFLINETIKDLKKAHEYSKGFGGVNFASTKQWEILSDDLFKKYMEYWEDKSLVSEYVAERYESLFEEAYNSIINLETSKLQD